MPIYEYACDKCHAKEEVIQKFGEPALTQCPQCHTEGSFKKVVTTSAFHLKGGGWYKDLYSSAKSSDKSATTKSLTSDTESKKESKVEKPTKKNNED